MCLVVVPLMNVGDAREEKWEAEGDPSFVEALLARPEVQATLLVHTEGNVHSEMLMRPEVVHDTAALLAVDHVSIDAANPARLERAQPGDGFSAEWVEVGIVLDGEGHVAAVLREHNPPPRAHIEERKGVRSPVPHLIHDPAANSDKAVPAAKAEAPLDLGMQPLEVGPESALVD
jgi:hypothetical protein